VLDDISLDSPYLFGALFISMWVAIGYGAIPRSPWSPAVFSFSNMIFPYGATL
jgi:hypothetical protein